MKKKIFQENIKIISNEKISKNYFKIGLKSSKISILAKPGQFVGIKTSDTCQPLLRRPFSIHRVRGLNIEILYEAVGKGTELLSQRKAGEYLDIIGPLGNGFNLNRQTGKQANRQTIIVAGGMGVAPLVFLAERLMSNEQRAKSKELLVLIGAKTKSQIFSENEFQELGCEVKISTDDGSRGFKSKVTELLKIILRTTHNAQRTTLYACGPKPMLKEISHISKMYKITAQVSLEEHMACGIGACLGCVVNTKEGFKRVCKEGPVFDAQEIIW